MTHITGPLLWTIAIYAMGTTCSTKMAKGLPQQQHLQLGLCLFPHFTTTLNPLLLYIYLSFHILFCFTILFFLTPYGPYYWQAAAVILGQGYKAEIQWMVCFMLSESPFYAVNFPCFCFPPTQIVAWRWVMNEDPVDGLSIIFEHLFF